MLYFVNEKEAHELRAKEYAFKRNKKLRQHGNGETLIIVCRNGEKFGTKQKETIYSFYVKKT